MNYGYIRAINVYDDVNVQKRKLPRDCHIFEELHTKSKKRYQLDQLLDQIRDNDCLYVTDLCILADSTRQLEEIIQHCSTNAITIHILNRDMVINSNNKIPFENTLKEITRFQSDIVSFRTKQGISNANSNGAKVGRPKRNDKNLEDAIAMYMSKKYTLYQIKEKTNISRATLYRHLDQ
ncbi:recombinase family protein [Staphylococcus massiliensis]|uniref:recombinase family protein n=1 Tax=Staphylococcus massiliensis TaxID=555791 RepID=UPI001EDE0F60|nr:recombinase family protein [Staphylococcus massiliensis]MCG3401489.1 recombinase family protein [Staphylococcus massiliensis]